MADAWNISTRAEARNFEDAELRRLILTLDGRGKEVKGWALDELLARRSWWDRLVLAFRALRGARR